MVIAMWPAVLCALQLTFGLNWANMPFIVTIQPDVPVVMRLEHVRFVDLRSRIVPHRVVHDPLETGGVFFPAACQDF